MSVHFNLGSHDARVQKSRCDAPEPSTQHGTGEYVMTCGGDAKYATDCCGDLCEFCFNKPADHAHILLERL